MKKYLVTLDCFSIERIEVEAANKKEAYKIAKRDSNAIREGAEVELFEIEQLK